MSAPMTTDAAPPRLHGSRLARAARWLTWGTMWLIGVALAGMSAQHIAADSHRWDARVSLPVRQPGASGADSFRTLSGGKVNLFATSLVHHHAGQTPFQGAIALRVIASDGTVVGEFVLGRGGIAHTQAQDSSWTRLAQLDAPRLWLRPWRFEARVLTADPAFPASHIEVMLRKERVDLGMGGMIFYVTIYVGLVLLAVATLLAGVWHKQLGHIPWIVSAVSLVVLGVWSGAAS